MAPFSKNSKYGKYFGRLCNTQNVCIIKGKDGLYCGAVIKSKEHNTKGMAKHLKSVHLIDEAELVPLNSLRKMPTLDQFQIEFKNSDSIGCTIARLISKDRIAPHCIAKSFAFQTLFRKAYSVNITEYYIWNELKKSADFLRDYLKRKLNGKKISVSVDDWTSRTSVSFCNVNVAAIVDNKMDNFCLGLVKLDQTDGKSLADKIIERLSTFGLSTKFITTDGAANMQKMSAHSNLIQQKCLVHGLQLVLTDLIFTKTSPLNFPDLEVECKFYKILYLELLFCKLADDDQSDNELEDDVDLIEGEIGNGQKEQDVDVLEEGKIKDEFKDLIKKVRVLMVYLKRSTKQRNIMRKYTQLSPIIDVCTRWNSTLYMLRRFIRIYNDLQKAALDSPEIKNKLNFSDQDLNALIKITKILEPFDAATKKLSEQGTNLHMADIILEGLVLQIDDKILRDKTILRIQQRRTCLSDILLFLKGEENLFYTIPQDFTIIEIYEKVILNFYNNLF